MKKIADLGVRVFCVRGSFWATHESINWSVGILESEQYWTHRSIVRKYFPNWKEYL